MSKNVFLALALLMVAKSECAADNLSSQRKRILSLSEANRSLGAKPRRNDWKNPQKKAVISSAEIEAAAQLLVKINEQEQARKEAIANSRKSARAKRGKR